MTDENKFRQEEKACCCGEEKPAFTGCLICGKPLVCRPAAQRVRCAVCGRDFEANCICEDGHYVCDACHEAGSEVFFLPFLLHSEEKDPLLLLEQVMALPRVHMHGPEHHLIVPCVLLAAYHNNGGELDPETALCEAVRRGGKVPGGSCGYGGVCGAAAGAGIYMSILLGATPLHKEAWPFPQKLVAECLARVAELGGPRCCKRTSRLCVTLAAERTADWLGVDMPVGEVKCRYFGYNRECIRLDCPYFPVRGPRSKEER